MKEITKEYKVYMHTFPNNKKYVGITKQDVNKRWCSGKHYKNQVVGKAIKKYGWENIKHEVIKENLSKEEACKLEQELISKHKSNQKEFGYNKSIGGEVGKQVTYMCQDAVQFINQYNTNPEACKCYSYWKFLCEDELESKVFNQAYLFVNDIKKQLEKEHYRVEWYEIVCAINTYLEAWQNNWTPECARYNSAYALINYPEIIGNQMFNRKTEWRKRIIIGSD